MSAEGSLRGQDCHPERGRRAGRPKDLLLSVWRPPSFQAGGFAFSVKQRLARINQRKRYALSRHLFTQGLPKANQPA